MTEKLPEWALTEARGVFVSTCAPLPTIGATGRAIDAIARALVEAERRGIERAAQVAADWVGGAEYIETAIRQLGDGS